MPVLSFGENDLYNQVRGGPRFRRFQDMIRNYTGISPVLVLGRGIFQYTFGFLPFRHPVTTVGKIYNMQQQLKQSCKNRINWCIRDGYDFENVGYAL